MGFGENCKRHAIEKIQPSQQMVLNNWISQTKMQTVSHTLVTIYKNQFKMDHKTKHKPKATKHLEENMGKRPWGLERNKDFPDLTTKA